MEDRFLTMEEAADRLGRTIQTVRLLIRNGKIPKYRFGIGRQSFIKESDIDDLLKLRPV